VPLGYRLPEATPHKLTGMLEAMNEEPFSGHADIPHLAETLEVPDESLFQLLEGGRLLNFVKVESGDVILLPAGQAFAAGDLDQRKTLFAEHLLKHISLASHICRVLNERPGHRAPKGRFLQELEDYLSDEEADRVLDLVINWGRYAEIFEYDDNSGVLSLPEPEEPAETKEGGDGAAPSPPDSEAEWAQ